jgi:isocitrate dehydrogenase
MSTKTPITIARGDGIGPEIMQATLDIILAAGAQLEIDEIEIGEKLYLKGINTGIEPSAWDSLRRTKIFLKAPITTPQGGGYKSLNVTARKVLGLYANVRPCVSYYPYVATKHPVMNLVIVRENEEDLYAGIEHRQTNQVYQALKLISRPGSEKIIRYAFEYARTNGRKKVTCFMKDNIMKLTDGLFHKVFDEIRAEYPTIESDHWIVDIGAAKMADTPENFDVIVMPNLYGDILSDVAAQIAGSVGLAGSSNIGESASMFEAIHGSAPRRANQNLANPSGLLLGSVMMLVHIGQPDIAAKVHNAWLRTLEDGVHTYDIYKDGVSKQKVGTKEFAEAVIKRVGQNPQILKTADYSKANEAMKLGVTAKSSYKAKKELMGVDIFLDYSGEKPEKVGADISKISSGNLALSIVENKGVKVYPKAQPISSFTDFWRCRYLTTDKMPCSYDQVHEIMGKISAAGYDVVKSENLSTFDGEEGFSSLHG